ncbi:hypothetical protein G6O67_006087 [Ophiocordyceps sinensis]|uniref:Steroid 5-alpha reductase C-terminal domain-containing protein n=1 Tax=Ophiocordyceps sinensis TaxID=72228 RepID=A0A8H4LU29_9HYPO|nr:hypothetical protein G6O67_008324 [Ophiocordyceps sinensis]KAF4507456.1 hypothetical protein G6O67_006087 [Ophiocordyceps sinensis]
MASLLNTLLRATNLRSPLLRVLVPSAAAALALQAAAAAPSILCQTERFYDISGSATVLAVGALSLYLPALRARAAGHITRLPGLLGALGARGGAGGGPAFNWRQLLVTAMAMAWTLRLGSYLFRRALSDGNDSRFDKYRTRPLAFAGCFLAQAVWVSLMMAPVFALNAAPAAALPAALGVVDVVGIGLWLFGIAFEATADAQKSRWAREKRLKLHDEDFLTSGLFGKSRFPHYFGEITLWTGLATVAAGALARTPVQLGLGLGGGLAGVLATTALAFVSPAFSAFLLTKVSGIPLSEGKYDKRYGGRKDYEEWKRNTPRLVPKLW